MADWDMIQTAFKERADEIEKVVQSLLSQYKDDLNAEIKAAKDDEMFDALRKINMRLDKFEQQLLASMADKVDGDSDGYSKVT